MDPFQYKDHLSRDISFTLYRYEARVQFDTPEYHPWNIGQIVIGAMIYYQVGVGYPTHPTNTPTPTP